MWHLTESLLYLFRHFRSRHVTKLVIPLRIAGIKAYHLTLLSFVFGLLAVWFLFLSHTLFVIFGVLHLLFDALDGVLARATKVTVYGTYFDWASDQTVAVLLLAKIAFFFPSIFSWFTVFLYVVYLLFFFGSRLQLPPLSARTIIFLLSFVGLAYYGIVIAFIFTLYVIACAYHRTFFRPRRKAM